MGSHQLFAAGPYVAPTAISDPTDISGLVGWWPAHLQSFSDNDPVAVLVDNSFSSNNTTQVTSGSRPTFKTNIVNGLAVVRFDGVDDFLDFPNDPGNTTTSFVVTSLNVAPASQIDYSAFIITASAAGLRILAKVGTSTNWGTFTSGDLVAGEDLVNGTFSILMMTTSPTGTSIYRNNVLKASNGVQSSGSGSGNFIGSEGLSRWVNADIADCGIYTGELSSGDRTLLYDYLALTFGI